MHKIWLYIWTNAASLRTMNTPTRTLVLDVAQEMAVRTTWASALPPKFTRRCGVVVVGC